MQHNPGFLALVESVLPEITEITIDDFQTGGPWQLVDVREDHEWLKDHLPSAMHIGRGILERDVENRFPDKETPILLYCGGGFRSALAAYNLQLMGYTRVASLAGGYRAWATRQLTLVRE